MKIKILSKRNQPYTRLLLYFLPFGAILLFHFWRSRFGFVSNDESFYFTTVFRLIQGDSLFKNEWHVSQLSAFPLLPIAYLALFIKNFFSASVFLILRYLYILVHAGTALFIFLKLKKTHYWGAIASSLCFFAYIPFSVSALSYNTICQISLILSIILFFFSEKKSILSWLLSGAVFAIAVLCCPLLIFLYLLGFVSLLIYTIQTKNKHWFTVFLYFSLGAGFIAILFFCFVLSRISISELFSSLPFILYDPEHDFSSFRCLDYFSYIWSSCSLNIGDTSIPISKIIILLYLVLLVGLLIDKSRKKHRPFYFLTSLALTFIYIISLFLYSGHTSVVMFPINCLAVFCVLLSDNEVIKKLFLFFWTPGMVYSYFLNFTSNQKFYAIASSSTVALVSSILIVFLFANEMFSFKTYLNWLITISVATLIVTQLSVELSLRYNNVYGDAALPLEEYCCKLSNGCQEGVYTTSMFQSFYDAAQADLNEIEDNSEIHSVLYVFGCPWFYLSTPSKEIASFSTHFWCKNEEYNISQLKSYYKINPDKIPDYVYFSYSSFYDAEFSEEVFHMYQEELFQNYTPLQMSDGITLVK